MIIPELNRGGQILRKGVQEVLKAEKRPITIGNIPILNIMWEPAVRAQGRSYFGGSLGGK